MEDYVKNIYDFLNGYVSKTFIEAKETQKTGEDRCVVLAVETRPDLITDDWCNFLLYLGVTKIEFGVQNLNPEVLFLNRRLHGAEQVIQSTKIVRNYGFKIGYHIMVGLPGSNTDSDTVMLTEELWKDEFSPDYLKIYPCIILKGNYGQIGIKKLLEKGWNPLDNETYIELINEIKPKIPRYEFIQYL